MPGSSDHWGTPYLVGSDNPDFAAYLLSLVNSLDNHTKFSRGTFATRPVSTPGSPGIEGRWYYATDIGRLFYDFGTGWLAVYGGDSVTSLPANPHNGMRVQLRLGSSPHEFISLVFDATYNKWISDVIAEARITAALGGLNSTNSAYVDILYGAIILPNFKDMYDAGLRPQFQTSAYLDSTSDVVFAGIAPRLGEFTDGDTALTSLLAGASGNGVRVQTSTPTWKAGGWVQPSITAPAENNVQLFYSYSVGGASGDTLVINNAVTRMRMVV